MKHIRQNGHSCLLATVCMLRQELNYKKLIKTYPRRSEDFKWANLWMWSNEHPETRMHELLTIYHRRWGRIRTLKNHHGKPNLNGRGVLIIVHKRWGEWNIEGHALAYEDEQIYDPARNTYPLSWTATKNHWQAVGWTTISEKRLYGE